LVDDLLLVPIRPIELFSKIKHAAHLSKVHDVDLANTNLKLLIEKIEEDIRTARSIQKNLIPEKFPQVYGFNVAHKYLSGMKSGGDYLDFFEFEDKNHVGILMSDSTGYGLSSAFMSVILRLAVKLSKEEAQSPAKTVNKIFDELQMTMKPNESLSIFFGVLNKKTFELAYTGTGNIRFFHGSESISFKDHALDPAGCLKGIKPQLKDRKVTLHPGERVILMTDGFFDAFETVDTLKETFTKTSTEDAVNLVNECVYRIKRKFTPDDDMPAQDCSVMVLDVKKRAMRLAK
jgi:sigma-B regulation protein RsbU (phosphoserine phosphatase)